MKKHFPLYFKSTPPPPYKLTPLFLQKKIHRRGGVVQTMDLYIETNIHSSILFSPPVHSTWWKYPTSWKFNQHFVYIFRTGWNFLIQICSSNLSYNRNILRSLYLKFKTSAHAQITKTHYYVLFTYFLIWYKLETYNGDRFW